MKKTIIKVDGMVCSGCENRIQNALQNIEGVLKVVADHLTKSVTVTSEEKVSEKTLKEKIEDLGYEVKED